MKETDEVREGRSTNRTYIRVKDWERFQHYKDRKPVWVKLYRDVLSDFEVFRLTPEDRWLLVAVWLLAAEHDNSIPNDPDFLARRAMMNEPVSIDALVDAGFVEVVDEKGKKPYLEVESRYISPELRTAIMDRDSQCLKCGKKSKLEIDHIVPIRLGGGSEEGNLQVLCTSCNRKKRHALEGLERDAPQLRSEVLHRGWDLRSTHALAREETEAETEGEEETDEEDVEAVDQSIGKSDTDTLRLLPRPALAALGDIKHLGGRRATARTLVTRYLYESEGVDAIPDSSIKGVDSLEARVALVAEALVEYGSQNDTFNPAHFRGFVRRIRNAPKAGTEAAKVAKAGEPRARGLQPYREEKRDPSELARVTAAEFAALAGVTIPTSEMASHTPEES